MVKRGHGRAQEKRYVAVLTCLQSRACHLEMVTSLNCDVQDGPEPVLQSTLSTAHDPCRQWHNFVATEQELREAVESLDHSDLKAQLAAHRIDWKFNALRAPHFCGAFERAVQSVKQALQTVLYQAGLTEEELCTALVQGEGLINSRPLTVAHQMREIRNY